ncbi:MAG: hypothetical protein KBG98_07815 [Desulfobacter sp.]|jgi:hypothetical protein|uniref:hypothetical protein n=1 Tax=Desulfobacter sp. TaxID=2294 RepID=UPI001B706CF3|nr:hypothetical protein [Desulfobacter sp.]MBP8829543.1 hypothetical protein [Desulfobacter sp.]MDQ1269728.1 hypothetical protein [Thermodesulfobacteriota bacterium]
MLVATREIILQKLLLLPALIDAYQQGEVGFADKAISWLHELEQSLAKLRSPLTSLASRQRARIVAAQNGFREGPLNGVKLSRTKSVNVTASQALGEVEAKLVSQVHMIDQKFDAWRDKLAQFISVASKSVPISLPPSSPRRDWLKQTWQSWGAIEETKSMYSYLNTVMSPGDRLHLFDELLENNMNSN